ncbi:MAG: hypothetical protein QG555_1468, partial [Thermodesulfobacteriota bacterium]|nr:hypothetical protein [Thermodesulfobacteriota bacterium]
MAGMGHVPIVFLIAADPGDAPVRIDPVAPAAMGRNGKGRPLPGCAIGIEVFKIGLHGGIVIAGRFETEGRIEFHADKTFLFDGRLHRTDRPGAGIVGKKGHDPPFPPGRQVHHRQLLDVEADRGGRAFVAPFRIHHQGYPDIDIPCLVHHGRGNIGSALHTRTEETDEV